MSYMALYRKFRPMEFEDVKGQGHIVTALKNQIKSNRVGHAYLFCGTRGTGKTTIAKIFAKAVNCKNPVDGSPCNQCDICKGINEQTSLNVIEIDAASNNSVENIRRIIEEVQYSPTEGKYKVYIIDEVHMLSTGAFNALLKTLEEPPSYVVFILATTEAHKLPVTILSRCQRYDFKRIQVDTIVERLKELTIKENIDATDEALAYIAKNADGALRDALSLLDQCNAFYLGEQLTYDKVLEVLGAVDNDIFMNMFKLLIENEATQIINLIDELILEGKDISQIIINFTWFVRNAMLLKTTNADASMVDMTKEMADELRKISAGVSIDEILRYIRVLSEAANQLKYATQKRVVAEMTFIKLCRPQMENDNQSLIIRVDNIERKLEKGVLVSDNTVAKQSEKDNEKEEEALTKEQIEEIVKALPEDIKELISKWSEVMRRVEYPIKEYLKNSKVYPSGDSGVDIIIQDEMVFKFMDTEIHRNTLKSVVFSVINKDVDIRFIYGEDAQKESVTSGKVDFSKLSEFVNMTVEIED